MPLLVGQGPTGAPFPTSEVATTPFPLRPGARMRDQDGNEYLFVDYTGSVFGGQPVEIASDYTAQAVGTSGRGPVGVACGAATSDNGGWVQIYGRCNIQLGMSGVSPSDAANGPTTLSTSVATKFKLGSSLSSPNGIGWVSDADQTSVGRFDVDGISVATDVTIGDTSAVTSATSHTGNQIAVFLNYPRIVYRDGVS